MHSTNIKILKYFVCVSHSLHYILMGNNLLAKFYVWVAVLGIVCVCAAMLQVMNVHSFKSDAWNCRNMVVVIFKRDNFGIICLVICGLISVLI